MAAVGNAQDVIGQINRVRQIRQYTPEPVSDADRDTLLEVARWSGSSRNTQPWHFVVVTDPATIRALSEVRTAINWVAGAPLAIALVLDGRNATTEAYDEGRVTERLLIAAKLLGLGGGTAWYGDADQQAAAKAILGIPAERAARSLVTIGHPVTTKDPRPGAVEGGRKPLSEIVSYGRYGASDRPA